ncbi:MAG: hypothetical protein J5679_00450 [Alphaproteobacteria bacterium]|nr:hypothetical protein [Alphaproteobacteria bacterium]
MQFKPNFDLYREWKDSEQSKCFASNSAYIAVFKRDNKTLVYMCDDHTKNISFNMVDMCFADDFGIKPDVFLSEMENADYDRKFNWHGYEDNTLAYAVGVAAKQNVPVVFADLSKSQYVDVINRGFPDNQITEDDLCKVFGSGGPNSNGNIYQQMSAYVDKFGRDIFMLENIAAALNKYDTVFCIFGRGHFESQRLVLEDMMGKPEYITKIKNMRGDFSNVKINPIKLCDFKTK